MTDDISKQPHQMVCRKKYEGLSSDKYLREALAQL